MPGHHIVPRFLIARWQGQDGLVTLADFEELVVRGERPDDLDAHPNFNRLQLHDDPEALEHKFFGALESNAARAINELVASRPPVEHAVHARANGFRPGQLLKGKRAVRFAQFLAAQAVRSSDWRQEANAHTAAAVAAEIETKVRGDLEAATDPEEIERLNGMLGLRYQAIVEGDTLPQLTASLATSIGEVLYCEYVSTVVRMPGPLLCLGNDPLVFMDEAPAVGVGSYSQIAARRGSLPFSVRRGVESFISAAVDVARGHKVIAMPVDPQHAIVLYPVERLPRPGLYSVGVETAQLLNGAATVASRRWLVVPPGRTEAARDAVYRASPGLRKADLYRAERGLPLHTDPRRSTDVLAP
jgi:uncharacterized protein DUF4238